MSPSPVKEQILEVATRLMAVRGYHRTSLDDVLRESGAGKGNFYHHFRSKEELGYAILDRLLARFEARTLAPVFGDHERDPLAQLDAFLGEILATQRARNCVGGCPMGNLATELADAHEGFRQRLAGGFDRWRQCLAAALSRAQAMGTLAPEADPEALARFLVAGIEGAILLAKVQKDIRVMEHCVAELRRHLTLYHRAAPVEAAGR
ncbi:MAG TPA: TetR family transcriptional regulator C-terminal domain-containing protein [Methylomirabilota bacterium]|jgi:TetR/AcrR family transcriptional repressor of nem operon